MATCETNGHLFGSKETCIMCGAQRVIVPAGSSDMIERVAKAIFTRTEHWVAINAWELFHSKDEFREQARHAILAMREPTEAMIEVGATAIGVSYLPDSTSRIVWRAVINEALEDGSR